MIQTHVSTTIRTPRLSIGLPVYNGARYLRESIDSLLCQTFDDFELIISDNQSTDETESICRQYALKDRRVRYHRLTRNIGAVPNFNRVFGLARGEFFKWAAHDDVCEPTFLERCVETLDADLSLAWCHSKTTHIDQDGQPLDVSHLRNVSYVDSDQRTALKSTRAAQLPHQRLRAVMMGKGGCCDSYGVFRCDTIRNTKLILPHFGAEQVFIAEIALWGRYGEIPETLFSMRVHSGCAGLMDSATQQQDYIAPQKKHRFQLTRLRMLLGYLGAIRRAKLSFVQRIRCLLVVARYLLQFSKWKRVITKALSGAGLVGDNLVVLRKTSSSGPTKDMKPPGHHRSSSYPLERS